MPLIVETLTIQRRFPCMNSTAANRAVWRHPTTRIPLQPIGAMGKSFVDGFTIPMQAPDRERLLCAISGVRHGMVIAAVAHPAGSGSKHEIV